MVVGASLDSRENLVEPQKQNQTLSTKRASGFGFGVELCIRRKQLLIKIKTQNKRRTAELK